MEGPSSQTRIACQLPAGEGGALFNTERKAKALFTRQTSRMLRRKGRGHKHISYWLGSSMANLITLHEGPKTAHSPSGLHLQMKHCIFEGLGRGGGDEEQFLISTAKINYKSLSEDLPLPRLAQEATDEEEEEEVKRVLTRLSSKVLNAHQRHRGEYISKNFYFCTTPKNGPAQESSCAWYPDGNIFARLQKSAFLARLKALFLHNSKGNSLNLHDII